MDGAGTPEGMTVGTGGSLSAGVAEGGGSAEGAADGAAEATAASLDAGARATAESDDDADGAAGAAAAPEARTSPVRTQPERALVGVRVEARTRILSAVSAVIATNYGLRGAL
jgi:hypothetical protein